MKRRFLKKLRRLLFPRKRSKAILYLEKEIVRKNNMIKSERERNKLLLDTIMRQSKEMLELKEKIREFNERLG